MWLVIDETLINDLKDVFDTHQMTLIMLIEGVDSLDVLMFRIEIDVMMIRCD